MLTLWQHQKDAVNACRTRRAFALLHDMGLGKTLTSLLILQQWFEQTGGILKTLIIAPLSTHENWDSEFRRYTSPEIYRRVSLLSESKRRILLLGDKRKQIFVLNPEAATSRTLWDAIVAYKFQVLIVDESQRFKTPDAKRTKALHMMADGVQFKLIATGTPWTNNLADIWAQIRILDRTIFPESYWHFQRRFLVDVNEARKPFVQRYFPDWRPRPGAAEQILRLIAPISSVMRKEDALDLPPLVRRLIRVTATPEAARLHGEMLKDLVADLTATEQASVDIVLVKILRCRQIMNGFLTSDSGKLHRIPCAKLDVLSELLTDIAPYHKTIVWSDFRQSHMDLERLCGALELPSVMVVGGQSVGERNEAIRSFREDESVRVLISNPAAGGVGLNLQAASYMIYFSKDFNYESDAQSEARAYRAGSEVHECITRIDLVTRDSIEEVIHESLENKERLAGLVVRLKQFTGVR